MFSTKERSMFHGLGFKDTTLHVFESQPLDLYRWVQRNLPLDHKRGPAAKSFRRCIKALMQRGTKEFNDLITLE